MSESGGRGIARKMTLAVMPAGPMIGVKPGFSERSLDDGANADLPAEHGFKIDRKFYPLTGEAGDAARRNKMSVSSSS